MNGLHQPHMHGQATSYSVASAVAAHAWLARVRRRGQMAQREPGHGSQRQHAGWWSGGGSGPPATARFASRRVVRRGPMTLVMPWFKRCTGGARPPSRLQLSSARPMHGACGMHERQSRHLSTPNISPGSWGYSSHKDLNSSLASALGDEVRLGEREGIPSRRRRYSAEASMSGLRPEAGCRTSTARSLSQTMNAPRVRRILSHGGDAGERQAGRGGRAGEQRARHRGGRGGEQRAGHTVVDLRVDDPWHRAHAAGRVARRQADHRQPATRT